ncbi:cytochrome c oxidase assembly protein cox15 [Aspergillus saccharolyticus JOP 1030-1]|uniref:Cytochrome c oxidase assembly protein Cox15 n=1 Tax=Aspergillus saccharolyticus JOP 1030-1 TaxID=1450539 RepID=A0A318ZFI3_9EURO|nr:cytochrome c oxidase assembly protein Cox15 [Aspergillus saccharolyticus JOP 1030-1]PYH45084.1 cytochrome c oxidase assembly protein Cox15 [Aspergillus saccharolyticus JOP 1030-1]
MVLLGPSAPLLRSHAPRLSREFFTCRPCIIRTQTYASTSAFRKPFFAPGNAVNTISLRARARSAFASTLRSYASKASKSPKPANPPKPAQTPKAANSPKPAKSAQAAAAASKPEAKRFFPDLTDKKVAYWLLASAASVFGIVVFGGLTRLTESGLSITEWRPVTGSIPPMNDEDWESEFSKYRASPEFQLLNPNMTLSEFKSIYYMEWIHRLWGRFVGLSFVLPAIYFVARKKVSKPMTLRLAGIAGLIGFQGFIGWWMVASGLKEDLFAPGSHPRVSQYRLTAHLGAAFVCYTAMLWNGLAILRSHRLLADPIKGVKELKRLHRPVLKFFRRSVAGLAALVFVTAMSGALVAGLDAGLIYNEFPYMGNGLTPPKAELLDPRYSQREDRSDLWWRNMLENPSLVQLDHRILALTTFTSIMALWAYSKRAHVKWTLGRAAKRGVHGVVALACCQVGLGISTLLYLVPTPLASAHQAGSLLLLTWVLVLGSRVWRPTRTYKLLQAAKAAQLAKIPPPAALATKVAKASKKPLPPVTP